MVAGFIQGAAGFGFALVLIPVLLFLGDARTAVFSAVMLSGPLNISLLLQTRRRLRREKVLPMVLASALGTPLGLLILTAIPEPVARAVASAVALIGAAMLLLRRSRATGRPERRALLWLAGFTGGLVNGATGMGGPPAALIVAAEGTGVQEARGLLSAFNLTSYPLSVGALIVSGSVHGAAILNALVWLPAAGLGMVLGSLVSRRAPDSSYRTIASGAAASAAICAILSILY